MIAAEQPIESLLIQTKSSGRGVNRILVLVRKNDNFTTMENLPTCTVVRDALRNGSPNQRRSR